MRAAVFDLDGTLMDTRPGIIGCVKYAMERFEGPCPDDAALAGFIGQPLRVTFAALLGASDGDRIEEAVACYRERYAQSGIYELKVYDGIREMLERLKRSRRPLYVATSKPAVYAKRIVEHFGFGRCFSGVYGPELDGRFDDKAELLAHLLGAEKIGSEDAVMIGDRAVDVLSARSNGMRSIGILWGFGSRDELSDAGADTLCATPDELALHLETL